MDNLATERKHATIAAMIGAIAMALFAIASIAVLLFYIYAFEVVRFSTPHLNLAWWQSRITSLVLNALSPVVLAWFFTHFARSTNPWGKGQSIRLLVAGLMLTLELILDCIRPEGDMAIVISRPHLFLEPPFLRFLPMVAPIVFIFCLAMVVRYANALQEDSDSIL